MNSIKSLTIASFALIAFFALTCTQNAHAQNALPDMPEPIKNLVAEGAQVRYLGRDYGFDSWITIKNGQEQYFYVLPDQSAFVMGLLFGKDGKLVTVDQVQRLRAQGDDLLDDLASDPISANNAPDKDFDLQSPSERLFYDIENSNWIPVGAPGAPALYAFIDPQCGHCHAFINKLREANYLQNGQVQLRVIPVGFREETIAQAAFLMATPDPQGRLFKHLDGDEAALPAKQNISDQGVQRNLAIMQSWKFDATPMMIYRGTDGTVKIVRGQPKNIPGLIADIAPQG